MQHLLAERPQTEAAAQFVVAKGPHRGQPLTPAGLRTVFRYHRERAGVAAAHPGRAAARHRVAGLRITHLPEREPALRPSRIE